MTVKLNVIYGVEASLEYFLEEVKSVTMAGCHPDRINEDDKFCPECGKDARDVSSEVKLRSVFSDVLPDYERDTMDVKMTEWLEGNCFPDVKIDHCHTGYEQGEHYIGRIITSFDDLLCGSASGRRINLGDIDTEEMKQTLFRLGFGESDIGIHVVPCVYY